MKRPVLLVTFTAASLLACQRDDSSVKDKLDSIDKRLEGIETALKSGARGAGAAGMDRGAQRPRPNPGDVYAVDIGNSPTEGSGAKVTIIEAFEFA
jgi:hypothetical protein